MKKCFKCGQVKPLDNFYFHPGMADGHLNKCSECSSKDTREHYAKNKEKRAQYDLIRSGTEKRKQQKRDINAASNKKHPERALARLMTLSAINKGALKITPCAECGETKVQVHHLNYYEPLNVVFLCRKHHLERHGKEVVVNNAACTIKTNSVNRAHKNRRFETY